MVLSGLTFSSWQAWLVGVYFVKKPRGLPSSTGFCFHPYVVYALTLSIVSYAFWVDCLVKLYPISSQLSLTAKILADAVILVTAVFDLYFRLNFYRLNTRLPELLIALEQPKYRPLNALFRKCWKGHKLSLYGLAVPRYILAFTLVCSYGFVTSHYPESAFCVPRYLYFPLFILFTAVPSVSCIIFAYDLIVITTFHMLWTFEDYCAHLEDHIYKGYFVRKRVSLNPTPSVRSFALSPASSKAHKNIGNDCNGTTEFRNLKRLSDAEEGKGFERMSFNCFVERFDWIHGLVDKYDRCIGPIILGVVVRCVFCIVHAVNAIALKTASQEMGLKSWYHVLVLLVEASQLVILKLGSEIHERVKTSHYSNKFICIFLMIFSVNSFVLWIDIILEKQTG